jgi:transposase
MKRPRWVRLLTDDERERIAAGLRSSDAFVLRRCQIVHASAAGERPPRIAALVGCDEQTVRNVVRAFNETGLACLVRGSPVARTIHRAFAAAQAERLTDLLHRSPRLFGHPTSVWTLPLAAEVSCAEGITPERVTGETVRATLARLGVRWRRAKHWITRPDPEYLRKKGGATG